LDYDSDSEVQFASDDSDNDFTHDFSEDSDGIVEADEEWQERREDKATVRHFTGPDPRLIRFVALDINGDSYCFDSYRLIFTEELFSTIPTEEPLLSAANSKRREQILLSMRYRFIDLIILMGHDDCDTAGRLTSCAILRSVPMS
jgi:hypothetical protein